MVRRSWILLRRELAPVLRKELVVRSWRLRNWSRNHGESLSARHARVNERHQQRYVELRRVNARDSRDLRQPLSDSRISRRTLWSLRSGLKRTVSRTMKGSFLLTDSGRKFPCIRVWWSGCSSSPVRPADTRSLLER